MHLNWMKCQGDVWCKLNSVNLSHNHFDNMHGVYIIWHGGTNTAVVYVGQGCIRDRLRDQRSNSQIQRFENLGLYVTWALASKQNLDGIEKYLVNTWKPIAGIDHLSATPIIVNSPWE